MVFEAEILSLLSGSVLDVKNTNEISSPASHEAIENLEKDP